MNLLIRSQMLYPIELRMHNAAHIRRESGWVKSVFESRMKN